MPSYSRTLQPFLLQKDEQFPSPWKWSGLYKQNEGKVAPYNFQCWTIKGDRASAWVSLSVFPCTLGALSQLVRVCCPEATRLERPQRDRDAPGPAWVFPADTRHMSEQTFRCLCSPAFELLQLTLSGAEVSWSCPALPPLQTHKRKKGCFHSLSSGCLVTQQRVRGHMWTRRWGLLPSHPISTYYKCLAFHGILPCFILIITLFNLIC